MRKSSTKWKESVNNTQILVPPSRGPLKGGTRVQPVGAAISRPHGVRGAVQHIVKFQFAQLSIKQQTGLLRKSAFSF